MHSHARPATAPRSGVSSWSFCNARSRRMLGRAVRDLARIHNRKLAQVKPHQVRLGPVDLNRSLTRCTHARRAREASAASSQRLQQRRAQRAGPCCISMLAVPPIHLGPRSDPWPAPIPAILPLWGFPDSRGPILLKIARRNRQYFKKLLRLHSATGQTETPLESIASVILRTSSIGAISSCPPSQVQVEYW